MLTNLINFFSNNSQVANIGAVRTTTKSNNPFANPFIEDSVQSSYKHYGKNKPVFGGYFAGYYNGKPNIVGQKLFIEV